MNTHAFVQEELLNCIDKLKKGEKDVNFGLYMRGGCGHSYSKDEIEMMEEILKLGGGIGVNCIVSKYSDRPLHEAFAHNNLFMIRFLLKHGADINVKRYDGRKPWEC